MRIPTLLALAIAGAPAGSAVSLRSAYGYGTGSYSVDAPALAEEAEESFSDNERFAPAAPAVRGFDDSGAQYEASAGSEAFGPPEETAATPLLGFDASSDAPFVGADPLASASATALAQEQPFVSVPLAQGPLTQVAAPALWPEAPAPGADMVQLPTFDLELAKAIDEGGAPQRTVEPPPQPPAAWPPAPRAEPPQRPTPAPEPLPVEGPLPLTVENVRPAALAGDAELRAAFEDAIRQVVAARAGVAPSAVRLDLRPGRTSIGVAVSFGAAPAQRISQTDLFEGIAAAVADVDGIRSAATGAISVAAGLPQTIVGTAGAAVAFAPATPPLQPSAPPAPKPSAAPLVAGAAARTHSGEACKPACVAGQGVCVDGLCLCKTPFTGVQCEKRSNRELMRFGSLMVVGLALLGVAIGAITGMLFFRAYLASQQAQSTEEVYEKNREVWRPAR